MSETEDNVSSVKPEVARGRSIVFSDSVGIEKVVFRPVAVFTAGSVPLRTPRNSIDKHELAVLLVVI